MICGLMRLISKYSKFILNTYKNGQNIQKELKGIVMNAITPVWSEERIQIIKKLFRNS